MDEEGVISRLRIGVVGVGGMGSNHARVVAESEFAELAVVVDHDRSRAAEVAAAFGCEAMNDVEAAVARCDAVVVATPTQCHIDVALPLLEHGIPLLVEKPLAPTVADVERLLEVAARTSTPIMCGFVERFNPALVTALGLVDGPVVGLHSVRHSPHNAHASASVVQDLLIHDIDLALRAAPTRELPEVSGAQWTPPAGGRSEVAECVLRFGAAMVANLSASRWGQRKVREVRIGTDSQLIEVDLLRVNVAVYRNISQAFVEGGPFRAETAVDVPYVRHSGEPLALQLQAFIELVRNGDADAVAAERDAIMPPHRVAALMEAT